MMNDRRTAFSRMMMLRVAEQEIANLYLREKIMSFVHFYVGEEAVAVGVSDALMPGDRALGNHRSHGHYLAKGGDMRRMLCELLGKEEGSSHGKGGSMHMIDKSVGFTGSTPILGSITSIAAGSAFVQRLTEDGGVTVCYIGDGASEEGGVFETMNIAALFRLPLLIVIENNLYSVNTKLHERRSRDHNLRSIVQGFGLTYERANGNDYEDVHSKARFLAEAARGGAPAVLECMVYRHMAHSAPIYDDAEGYREEDLPEKRRAEDCIERMRALLLQDGCTATELDKIEADIRANVLAQIEYALQAPYPDSSALHTDLYV